MNLLKILRGQAFSLLIVMTALSLLMISCKDERTTLSDIEKSSALTLHIDVPDYLKSSLREAQEGDARNGIKSIYIWAFESNAPTTAAPVWVSGEQISYNNMEIAPTHWQNSLLYKRGSNGTFEIGKDYDFYIIANYGTTLRPDYAKRGVQVGNRAHADAFDPNSFPTMTKEQVANMAATIRSYALENKSGFIDRVAIAPLMSGVLKNYNVTGKSSKTSSIPGLITPNNKREFVTLKLKRVDAEVKFNVIAGNGIALNLKSWRVMNIPMQTNVFEKSEDLSDTKYLRYPFTLGGKTLEGWRPFEKGEINTKADGFVFYMPENRPDMTKVTNKMNAQAYMAMTGETVAPQESDTDYLSKMYPLRDRRTKVEINGNDPAHGQPKVLDGTDPEGYPIFEYAPKNASYIEFITDVEYTKDNKLYRAQNVKYTVHLGFTTPSESGAKPSLDDFDTERNISYTYNVTINGMNDIITEVTKNNEGGYGSNNYEKNPGVEGHVSTGKVNNLKLDCHYVHTCIVLNWDDILKSAMSNSDRLAQINFLINSPYQTNGKLDEGWLIFYLPEYIHNSTTGDEKIIRSPLTYYQAQQSVRSGVGRIFYNIKDLIDAISLNDKREDINTHEMRYFPEYRKFLINAYNRDKDAPKFAHNVTHDIIIHVFVKEYYYDSYPMGRDEKLVLHKLNVPTTYPTSNGDQPLNEANWVTNGWRTFVNQPARSFRLYIGPYPSYSSDGKSSYAEPAVSIEQRSIIAPYNLRTLPPNYIGFGYESVDETEGYTFGSKFHTSANKETDTKRYYMAGYGTDGITQYDGRRMYLDKNISKSQFIDESWYFDKSYSQDGGIIGRDDPVVTVGNTDKGKTYPEFKNYFASVKWDYAWFAPVTRNTDENADGKIQANEIKWYLPSMAQIEYMWQNDASLPSEEQLSNHAAFPFATGQNNSNWNYLMFYAKYGTTLRKKIIYNDYIAHFNTAKSPHRPHNNGDDFSYYYDMPYGFEQDGAGLQPDYTGVTLPRPKYDPNFCEKQRGTRGKFVNVRCCRNLGVRTQDEKVNTRPVRRWQSKKNTWGDESTTDGAPDNTLIIDCSSMPEKSLRGRYIEQGELPHHTIYSRWAYPYQAFYVASESYFKKKGISGSNDASAYHPALSPDKLLDPNNPDHPCKTYKENGITGWRMPNSRELQLMGRLFSYGFTVNMVNWQKYGLYNLFIPQNGWAYNVANNPNSDATGIGNGTFQMSNVLSSSRGPNGEIYYLTDFFALTWGFRLTPMTFNSGSQQGFPAFDVDMHRAIMDVRCVKDLSPEELNQLHSTGIITGINNNQRWSSDNYGM